MSWTLSMMEIDGESTCVSICVLVQRKKQGEILIGICQDECVNYKLGSYLQIFWYFRIWAKYEKKMFHLDLASIAHGNGICNLTTLYVDG
jgi:hypothetical protein